MVARFHYTKEYFLSSYTAVPASGTVVCRQLKLSGVKGKIYETISVWKVGRLNIAKHRDFAKMIDDMYQVQMITHLQITLRKMGTAAVAIAVNKIIREKTFAEIFYKGYQWPPKHLPGVEKQTTETIKQQPLWI